MRKLAKLLTTTGIAIITAGTVSVSRGDFKPPGLPPEVYTLPGRVVSIGITDFATMLIKGESLPEYAWAKLGRAYDDLGSQYDHGVGEYAFNVTFKVTLGAVTGVHNLSGTIIKRNRESFESAFRRRFGNHALTLNIQSIPAPQGGLFAVGGYRWNGRSCVYGTCGSGNTVCQRNQDGNWFCRRV